MSGFTYLPAAPGTTPRAGETAEDTCSMNEPMSKVASQQSKCESEAFPTQASRLPGAGKEHGDARTALPLTATQGRG